MDIDTQTVSKIGKLARIAIKDEDKAGYSKDLSSILNWVEQMSELNTDNVPQLFSVTDATLPRRKDEITDGNQQDAIVKNAPQSDYGCFAVPKVME